MSMGDESHVLVVTGSRKRDECDEAFHWFCDTFFVPRRVKVGCARGVDLRTRVFFRARGIQVDVYVAIWRKNNIFNHYAGHDRNEKMIVEAPIDAHLLALPLWLQGEPDWKNCTGTEDCYNRGRARGLQCHLR
jgi:hypothetical protein